MACKVKEIFRLRPADGVKDARTVLGATGEVAATMLIYNPLTAPVYFRFGAAPASATEHDVACPGQAIMAWPIDPGVDRITALVKYPGAVPAVDVADCVVRVTSAQLPAFVGPLA